ncbi:hypothetical protein, partial [Paraprevotella clara]
LRYLKKIFYNSVAELRSIKNTLYPLSKPDYATVVVVQPVPKRIGALLSPLLIYFKIILFKEFNEK